VSDWSARLPQLKHAGLWAVLVLALVLPPLFGSYFHFLGALALINVIIAIGLNLLTGNAGQISVCHSSFMAIGAYATTFFFARLGIPYLLALPLGGLVAAVCGLLLGFPALRVRGFYLAVVTLGFLEITQILVEEFPQFTGGVRGIASPRPAPFGISLTSDLAFYYFVMAFTLLAIWFARSVLRSPTGRAFNAIRNNEAVSQTLAIPLARTKLIAFVLSAFYAGIGGGLYATSVGFIDPLEFGVLTSVRHVTFIVVGGVGSLAGSVVGAIALTMLPEALRSFKEYNEFIYGGLLLLVLIAFPKGLVGLWNSLGQRLVPVREELPRKPADQATP
jgi:branched-chain amino acid transport system permease protein